MPNRTEWNKCKVCERRKVKFEYWESGSNADYFSTDYESKSKKAFICPNCYNALKKVLKDDGKEICQKCWSKLNYGNYETSNWSKPIGQDCQTCQRRTEQDQKESKTRQNEADNARIRQEIEENSTSRAGKALSTCASCQKDISQETSYYFPSDKLTHYCVDCYPKQNKSAINNPIPNSLSPSNSNQSNNSPSTQQILNQQGGIRCYNCQKEFQQGDKAHYFPQEPNTKWCDPCNPQVNIFFQAFQQILAGQTVATDQLNIPFDKQQVLNILARIKRGDPVVVDEMLGISDEDKENLKVIQQKLNGEIISGKKPINEQGVNSLPWGKIVAFNVIVWPLIFVVVLIIRRQKRIRSLKIE